MATETRWSRSHSSRGKKVEDQPGANGQEDDQGRPRSSQSGPRGSMHVLGLSRRGSGLISRGKGPIGFIHTTMKCARRTSYFSREDLWVPDFLRSAFALHAHDLFWTEAAAAVAAEAETATVVGCIA